MVKILAGFMMCPKCGGFMEISENSHAIICHKCGTLHTLSASTNKALYSKHIHPANSLPDYSPRYGFRYLCRLPYGKTGAIISYKLYLTQRKIFQTACRIMHRGLYAQALEFFAIIPNFEGVAAKVQECRKRIDEINETAKREKIKRNLEAVIDFIMQWPRVIFIIAALGMILGILEALLS